MHIGIEAPFADSEAPSLVNLARYPLHAPDSAQYARLIETSRATLRATGALQLRGLLSTAGLARLADEGHRYSQKAAQGNVPMYPIGLPAADDRVAREPGRWARTARARGLGYHAMQGTAMAALYRWAPLRDFVAKVTEQPRLYLHDDPSNALVLMTYGPGDELPWHFDTARFSSILHLTQAAVGGEFEYVADLRPQLEVDLQPLVDILDGRPAAARQAPTEPGSLTVIAGARTLHRVTPVGRDTVRRALILCYDDVPGQRMDVETRRRYFGPDAPDNEGNPGPAVS
ncbi:MAG: 2OG-Fe(II) oxygenase [Myxococcales bacterium]|nr:2OG-Fe(II) oxygenase [Myxococcales bacterium]